jgi:hypothetical protein
MGTIGSPKRRFYTTLRRGISQKKEEFVLNYNFNLHSFSNVGGGSRNVYVDYSRSDT